MDYKWTTFVTLDGHMDTNGPGWTTRGRASDSQRLRQHCGSMMNQDGPVGERGAKMVHPCITCTPVITKIIHGHQLSRTDYPWTPVSTNKSFVNTTDPKNIITGGRRGFRRKLGRVRAGPALAPDQERFARVARRGRRQEEGRRRIPHIGQHITSVQVICHP